MRALLITLLFTAPPLAAAEERLTDSDLPYGAGHMQCAPLLEEYGGAPDTSAPFGMALNWMQGFVSGAMLWAADTPGSSAQETVDRVSKAMIPLTQQIELLVAQCKANPDQALLQAVQPIATLGVSRIRLQPPAQ